MSALYRKLLGKGWGRLGESIRAAHRIDTRTRGIFIITHGNNRLARLFVRLSGLPKAGKRIETLLAITASDGIEEWQRHFDGQKLTTRQWAAQDGLLIEEFQGWELGFELREEDGALVYHQRRAHLRFGPLRLRVPLACAPRVRACERCIANHRTAVEVFVSLPLVGRLIGYQGELQPELPANP